MEFRYISLLSLVSMAMLIMTHVTAASLPGKSTFEYSHVFNKVQSKNCVRDTLVSAFKPFIRMHSKCFQQIRLSNFHRLYS